MGIFTLVYVQPNIFDKRIDFFLLSTRVSALEIIENIEMFTRGQEIKKHVMLRAYSHELTNLIHILKNVNVITDSSAM